MKTPKLTAALIFLCLCLVTVQAETPDTTGTGAAKSTEEDKPDLEAVAKGLESRFYYDRFNAFRILVHTGKEALPLLVERMKRSDRRLAPICIDALVLIGDKSILPELVKLAAEKGLSPDTKNSALRAIYFMDPFGEQLDVLASKGLQAQAAGVKMLLKQHPEVIERRFDIENVLLSPHVFKNSSIIPLLNEQPEVKKVMEEISGMIKTGNLDKALRSCQKLLNMNLTRPVQHPSDERVAICFSTAHVAGISDFIAANLARYRQIFDITARNKLSRIAEKFDPVALDKFLRSYCYTSCGRDAFEMLIAYHYERGNFREVSRTWRAHNALFPGVSAPTLGRVGCALARTFQPLAAKIIVHSIRTNFPKAGITTADGVTGLAEFVENIIKSSPVEPTGDIGLNNNLNFDSPLPSRGGIAGFNLASPHWVNSVNFFRGRMRFTACSDFMGNTVYVPPWELPEGPDRKTRNEFELRTGLTIGSGGTFPIDLPGPYLTYPYSGAVHKDSVVISNGNRVVSYSLTTGKTLWVYDNSIDSVELSRNDVYAPFQARFNYVTISPDEGRVYVTIKAGDMIRARFEAARRGEALQMSDIPLAITCLNLSTGKRVWSTEHGGQFLENMSFESPPLFRDGVIYANVLIQDTEITGAKQEYDLV